MRGTHGKEIILYSMPSLVPICGISDICATHGLITDTKDPEMSPYATENSITETSDLAKNQKTRHESPERNADGARRLKRPSLSDR
jgi:hypothetical protein